MVPPNEFWLQLHRLSEAYQAEGLTEDDRVENIVEQFRNMPHLARRALMSDLATIALSAPGLYPLIIAANGSEVRRPNAPKEVA